MVHGNLGGSGELLGRNVIRHVYIDTPFLFFSFSQVKFFAMHWTEPFRSHCIVLFASYRHPLEGGRRLGTEWGWSGLEFLLSAALHLGYGCCSEGMS